jgi:hypothetical protein
VLEKMHGEFDMKKEAAIQIQKSAHEAMQSLLQIASIDAKQYAEYEEIKKGVGMCIGHIQMEILEVINKLHPELDDLK